MPLFCMNAIFASNPNHSFFLQNLERRNAFMDELNSLVESIEFTVVAAVIEKRKLTKPDAKFNIPYTKTPYSLALMFLPGKNI